MKEVLELFSLSDEGKNELRAEMFQKEYEQIINQLQSINSGHGSKDHDMAIVLKDIEKIQCHPCYFCENGNSNFACTAIVNIHGQSTKYDKRRSYKKIPVPRCKKCKSVHTRTGNIASVPGFILFFLLILYIWYPIWFPSDWIPFFDKTKFQNIISHHWIIALFVLPSPIWFPLLISNMVQNYAHSIISTNTKTVTDGFDFPPAKKAWEELKGARPTFTQRNME